MKFNMNSRKVDLRSCHFVQFFERNPGKIKFLSFEQVLIEKSGKYSIIHRYTYFLNQNATNKMKFNMNSRKVDLRSCHFVQFFERNPGKIKFLSFEQVLIEKSGKYSTIHRYSYFLNQNTTNKMKFNMNSRKVDLRSCHFVQFFERNPGKIKFLSFEQVLIEKSGKYSIIHRYNCFVNQNATNKMKFNMNSRKVDLRSCHFVQFFERNPGKIKFLSFEQVLIEKSGKYSTIHRYSYFLNQNTTNKMKFNMNSRKVDLRSCHFVQFFERNPGKIKFLSFEQVLIEKSGKYSTIHRYSYFLNQNATNKMKFNMNSRKVDLRSCHFVQFFERNPGKIKFLSFEQVLIEKSGKYSTIHRYSYFLNQNATNKMKFNMNSRKVDLRSCHFVQFFERNPGKIKFLSFEQVLIGKSGKYSTIHRYSYFLNQNATNKMKFNMNSRKVDLRSCHFVQFFERNPGKIKFLSFEQVLIEKSGKYSTIHRYSYFLNQNATNKMKFNMNSRKVDLRSCHFVQFFERNPGKIKFLSFEQVLIGKSGKYSTIHRYSYFLNQNATNKMKFNMNSRKVDLRSCHFVQFFERNPGKIKFLSFEQVLIEKSGKYSTIHRYSYFLNQNATNKMKFNMNSRKVDLRSCHFVQFFERNPGKIKFLSFEQVLIGKSGKYSTIHRYSYFLNQNATNKMKFNMNSRKVDLRSCHFVQFFERNPGKIKFLSFEQVLIGKSGKYSTIHRYSYFLNQNATNKMKFNMNSRKVDLRSCHFVQFFERNPGKIKFLSFEQVLIEKSGKYSTIHRYSYFLNQNTSNKMKFNMNSRKVDLRSCHFVQFFERNPGKIKFLSFEQVLIGKSGKYSTIHRYSYFLNQNATNKMKFNMNSRKVDLRSCHFVQFFERNPGKIKFLSFEQVLIEKSGKYSTIHRYSYFLNQNATNKMKFNMNSRKVDLRSCHFVQFFERNPGKIKFLSFEQVLIEKSGKYSTIHRYSTL